MHFLSGKKHEPAIQLGYKGIFPYDMGLGNLSLPHIRSPYRIKGKQLRSHEHVMGITGGGKSYYLVKKYTDLVMQGIGAALIDPHGDLADDCLRVLIDRGYFQDPEKAFQKLWYIDFTRKDRFVPFNFLNVPYQPYTIGRHTAEAFKRAYPANLSGEGTAPVFTDMCQFTTVLLVANQLSIVHATRVLTDKSFREALLKNTNHFQTHEYFRRRFDQWEARDRASKIESFLNKVSDLTFTDPVCFAVGQQDNLLDFKQILNEGISLIINIHVDDQETKRLLGCLINHGLERAALTRTNTRTLYHLMLDEFHSFSTADGKTESTFLSEARKYNVILTLAHQTIDQLSESMKSSTQNMTIETFFGLGHDDAQLIAPRVGRYNPFQIKHKVKALKEKELTVEHHPMYFQMQETWEVLSRKLENLHPQEGYVKIKRVIPLWQQMFRKPFKTFKFRSCTIPPQQCSDQRIQDIKDRYASMLLKGKEEIVQKSEQRGDHTLLPQPAPQPMVRSRSRF